MQGYQQAIAVLLARGFKFTLKSRFSFCFAMQYNTLQYSAKLHARFDFFTQNTGSFFTSQRLFPAYYSTGTNDVLLHVMFFLP